MTVQDRLWKLQVQALRFLEDPFLFYDSMKIQVKNWDLNFIKEDAKMRYVMLRMIVFFAGVWAVMGFDSGVGQIEFPIMKLVEGQIHNWDDVVYWYNWAYGKYMHWSVFVIYGLMFCGLSRYYSGRYNIKGSRNFVYSFSFTLLSIGIFEYYWMLSFWLFQNQPWILTFQWPQAKLLLQNFGLTFVGLLCILHIIIETPLKPRIDRKTVLAASLGIMFCALWIYYPYNVMPLQVETTMGLWHNSQFFPQTVYTIDIDPLDAINAGEQFYIEDNLIHLVNTLAKVFVTLAVSVFGLLVPKDVNSHNRIE